MKLKSKHFIILLLLSILICFSGCGIIQSHGIIDATYSLNSNKLDEYLEVSNEDSAVVVSQIVMPATVEIESKIDFSYRAYSMWGGQSQIKTGSQTSKATGFFINEEGYMVTNAHVVTISDYENLPEFTYTSREILINYADSSKQFNAEIIAYDETLDLAILKVDASKIENFKYVTFFNLTDPESEAYKNDDACKLYYGEVAIAIGNAQGYGISVTQGIVSAPVRYFAEGTSKRQAIQTDAAINEGNSGGPLSNKYGTIIGINSFKIVTDTSENLGYAIPSNVILKYIDSTNKDIKYYYTSERVMNPNVLSNK